MELAAIDAQIAELERQAEHDPQRYLRRVGRLALLGLVTVLALCLAGIALLVGSAWCWWVLDWHPLVCLVGGICGAVLSWQIAGGLFWPLGMPAGIRLDRQGHEAVWQVVDEITTELEAPVVADIILDDDLQAGMAQVARLGVFGWYRPVLILGLPLARSLSLEELRAVIAHEVGHHLGGHGRLSARFYRLRMVWARLYASAGESKLGGGLVRMFLNWYGPLFDRYTFVLARQHEYEADKAGRQVTSAATMARALVRTGILHREAGEHAWPAILRRAADEAEPPADALDQVTAHLNGPMPEAERWCREDLARPADCEDTHPSLTERLEALGVNPASVGPPPPIGRSAASELLGDDEPICGEQLNAQWSERIYPHWLERHVACEQMRQRVDELRARSQRSETEDVEILLLELDITSDANGMEACRDVLAVWPDCAWAHCHLGRLLVEADDPTGLEHLERAIVEDHETEMLATAMIAEWHRRHGAGEAARQLDQQLVDRGELEELAAVERNKMPKAKQLRPHGLEDHQLADITAAGEQIEFLKSLHIARVQVEHLSERPHYLIVVRYRLGWLPFRSDRRITAVNEALLEQLQLEGSWLLISERNEQTARIARKIVRLFKEPVYKKS